MFPTKSRNPYIRVFKRTKPAAVSLIAWTSTVLLALNLLPSPAALAQPVAQQTAGIAPPLSRNAVPDRLIVVYRNQAVPAALAAHAHQSGALIANNLSRWGIAIVQGDGATDPALRGLQSQLAADPEVAFVSHDSVVSASRMVAVRGLQADVPESAKMPSTPDWYYTSTPQGWAVKQVGGYGANTPGAPAHGPWDVSMGQGVKIAVLDSGVSSTHPDTAANLVYATSLVDQTALPSPCDDGSAEDQDGHGTWVASLAAGAIGKGTGMVVGVAPKASLLNIKVLERVPAAGNGSTASLCEQGTASGLMSWMISGIAAASQQGANVISISAGNLLDTYSGEDEGTIAAINRAVYNATQAGALVIAAAGNNGESLDSGRYVEMPAQAVDAVAVVASTNPVCAQNLTVSATCQTGAVSIPYYSNYGSTIDAVAAPGGSYPEDASGSGVTGFVRGACAMGLPNTQDGLPALPGHSFGCFGLGHVQYVEAIGTSASAPLVAGVAALLRGANPLMTPAQIAATLRSSASTLPQPSSAEQLKLVNAAQALQAMQQ